MFTGVNDVVARNEAAETCHQDLKPPKKGEEPPQRRSMRARGKRSKPHKTTSMGFLAFLRTSTSKVFHNFQWHTRNDHLLDSDEDMFMSKESELEHREGNSMLPVSNAERTSIEGTMSSLSVKFSRNRSSRSRQSVAKRRPTNACRLGLSNKYRRCGVAKKHWQLKIVSNHLCAVPRKAGT